MTQLLDNKGKPIGPVQGTVKKAHDPAELKRERTRLNQLFANLMKQFVDDLTPPENFPSTVEAHVEAVMKHYDETWRETARVVNESTMPLTVNADLMRKEMERYTADMRMAKLSATPISAVADLGEYHLLPLILVDRGLLHINTQCAVAIDDKGQTTVWLRSPHEDLEHWCSGWVPKPLRMPVVEAAAYTLGELNNLLAVTRRQDVCALNDAFMAKARETILESHADVDQPKKRFGS